MVVAALGCATPTESRDMRSADATRFWMRNVVMFPFDNAPATVLRLSGTAVPTRPGRIIDMDDVTSYAVRVRHAEMMMPAATMSALMNQYLLPRADTAIKRVDVTFGDGVIFMRGTMQKGIPIGFTAQGVAAVTPTGEMRITVVKMKTAGFIPKKVMDAVGLKMSKVAQPDNRQVFRIVGDTMIVPVSSMFPPPKFLGPLRSVRVTPQGMFSVIGTAPADKAPPRPGDAPYIHLQGGQVNFARLTMRPTNLSMVPKKPAMTLGYSPTHYYRQLVAGYSTSLPNGRMVGHVADYRAITSK